MFALLAMRYPQSSVHGPILLIIDKNDIETISCGNIAELLFAYDAR